MIGELAAILLKGGIVRRCIRRGIRPDGLGFAGTAPGRDGRQAQHTFHHGQGLVDFTSMVAANFVAQGMTQQANVEEQLSAT